MGSFFDTLPLLYLIDKGYLLVAQYRAVGGQLDSSFVGVVVAVVVRRHHLTPSSVVVRNPSLVVVASAVVVARPRSSAPSAPQASVVDHSS